MGASLVDTATLGYVPLPQAVAIRSGEMLTLSFGPVKNPSTVADAIATMEVVFTTDPDSDGGAVTFPPVQTIGGLGINLPNEVTVLPRVSNLKVNN